MQRLTWDEIVKQYPDQWVGLTDVERTNESTVKSAAVSYSGLTKNEALKLAMDSHGEIVARCTKTSLFQPLMNCKGVVDLLYEISIMESVLEKYAVDEPYAINKLEENALCLLFENNRWTIATTERGKRNTITEYANVSDACKRMLSLLGGGLGNDLIQEYEKELGGR